MKAHPSIIPIFIVLCTLGGISASGLFSIPSFSIEFPHAGFSPENLRTSKFLIEGLRCVDTATRAASTLKESPGVIRFVAFASRNTAEITYDPRLTNPDRMREMIEEPFFDKDTGEFIFNVFKIIEIDSTPVAR
jgi:hypothetical protein